ncbi:thioredoxin-dependent thiol peroxidase [Leptospira harrisiae]|uniref:thioredoxin-dependent peroxiredoxin n=1 Tax=Leptospira harrisiae TaxID=2023189 RepID=A0A2N0AL27_9LEPT|nr:thioredoxin-dependent thiol peroxidase [Leptospira harrisiae]PKA08424.1 thioredoxin-dependent thiol peroxidase [Leptospira harrisiae]
MLEVGKKAPNFTSINQNGEKVKLADLTGKNGIVVYFYPRDMTPGCTTEACDFRDNFARLKKFGFNVVGISKDNPKSHTKFIEKQELNFDLISDESGEICEAYGVWREKVFMGRKGLGIVRSSFLLDSSLKIKKIYDSVKVKGHVEEIIKDIQEIQGK